MPALCLALACSASGLAQDYPTRPVRLVVGFAPGGANDLTARVVARKLTETLGQSVIVDNRPGAAGNLAAAGVARAEPDGYTLFLANPTVATPTLFTSVAYDVRKDFAPISLVGHGPVALSVHPSLPIRSVKEIISLARRRPGELNCASGGAGNITHLAMELFVLMSNTAMVHVPYKGGAPAATAVVSGEAQLCFCSVAAIVPYVKSGRLRALAVSSAKRSVALPQIPTVSEAGVPGYEASSWYGVLAPANTPPAVVAKLSQHLVAALQTPELREKLNGLGIEGADSGPKAFAQYLGSEIAKWEKVIKAARIPPQ